jgi:beta-glucosidase/6-phospho-beta-glucosidase/beta-galactosidase
MELLGAFESTYLPAHDVDVAETTGHIRHWRSDLDLLASCGVRALRYPVRWHRVEEAEGHLDWAATDVVLGHLREAGFRPIVDLVHHTSYPRWLTGGFADPRFGPAYLRYVRAFARRYPWVEAYTLFNEPFSTLFLAAHEGIWPPYHQGLDAFVAVLGNVLPWIAEAGRLARELLPDGRHVYVDTCERHSAAVPEAEAYARLANDRRFVVLDALLGRLEPGPDRPFAEAVARAGGEDLFHLGPTPVDVLGLDYYAHCQWQFTGPQGGGTIPSPAPDPLTELIIEYADRYRLPVMLTETNLRGTASDRASWLKFTLEQCERAIAAGVDVEGYCWFPSIDSCDWDSLLFRCDGNIDPVGVFWLDEDLRRRQSSMSRSFAAAAGGAPSADLPAYRFQEPAASWLAGFLPFMAHWDWQPPPVEEQVTAAPPESARFELRITDAH